MPSSLDLHAFDNLKKRVIGKKGVAERLVFSRFYDTQAADRNINGVNILLPAMEDTRIEVSVHAAAKAQAAQIFKQPVPGRGEGGNADRLTQRPDKSLKDNEEKEKYDKREKDKARLNKKPEQDAQGLWCAPPRRFMQPNLRLHAISCATELLRVGENQRECANLPIGPGRCSYSI
jgi:hypothetical protein